VEFNRYYTKIKPLLVIFMLLSLIVAAQQLTQKKTTDTRGIKASWVLHDAGIKVLDDALLWQPGHRVAAGSTKQSVTFKLSFQASIDVPHISVSPVYLERVAVEFFDKNGQLINQQIKGGGVAAKTLDHHYDIDRLIFDVPNAAATAQLNAKAIQNLNVRLSYPSTEQVASQHTWGLALKGAVLTVILLAAGLALVAGVWFKQVLFLAFAAHQLVWFLLLLSVSHFIPSIWPHLNPLNGRLLGAVVIIVVITGAGFHWILLRNMKTIPWLSGFCLAVVLLSFINLALYFFVDQRLSLIIAAGLTAICGVILIVLVPWYRPKDHLQGLIFKKIQNPYTFFMSLVVLAAVSRLGFGPGLQTNGIYFYSLVTIIMMGQVLWMRTLILQRRQQNMAKKAAIVHLTNEKLARDLVEQSAFLSMLSHEIKTPLTTLRFTVGGSDLRNKMDAQLTHIQHVVDKVELMGRVGTDFVSSEKVFLTELIQDQWRASALLHADERLLDLTSSGCIDFVGNKLALEVIVHDLLTNARKYANNSSIKVKLVGSDNTNGLCVIIENETDELPQSNIDELTDKYFRGPNSKGIRGTGLGLWIVKNLCGANKYALSLECIEGVFSAIVRLK
jgi:signal transduction histidine kinase